MRRLAIAVLAVGSLSAFALPPLTYAQTRTDQRADRQAGRRYVVAARSALRSGEVAAAQAYLDSLQAVDSDNQEVPYLGARLRLAAGDTAGAETILEEGIVRAPLAVRLKLLSAGIAMARGRTAVAEKLLDEVNALTPGDPEAAYLSGLLALAASDTTGALDLWDRALEAAVAGGRR